MPNLFIFTSGTSLLSNLRRDVQGNQLLPEIEQCFQNRMVQDIFREPAAFLPAASRAIAFYGCGNPSQSTAELSSFSKLTIGEGDQVVLLGSDTTEGMFCALVNAHLMVQVGADSPVVVWEKPGIPSFALDWHSPQTRQCQNQGLAQRALPQTAVMRVSGLDPSNIRGFEDEAVGNLVRAVASLVKFARGAHPELEPAIVFTGGFKVSLPVLTQAASWLGGVPMYGMHEISAQLITIPVLNSDFSTAVRNGVLGWAWKAGRSRQQIGSFYSVQELEEWAMESSLSYGEMDHAIKAAFSPDGGVVKLNILGEALLAVILAALPANFS